MNTYTNTRAANNVITIKLKRPRDFLIPVEGSFIGELDEIQYSSSTNKLRTIFQIRPQQSLTKIYDAARSFDLADTGTLSSFLSAWLGEKLQTLLQPDGSISIPALESLVGHPALLDLVLITNPKYIEAYRHINKIAPAPTFTAAASVSSPPPGHQMFPGAAGKTSIPKRRAKPSSPMAGEGDDALPF